MKFTSNYVDMLDQPRGERRVVRVHRRQDPRRRATTPTTAERLIPKDHRYGEKRPPYVTGYFEAFNRPERGARRPARRRRSCG